MVLGELNGPAGRTCTRTPVSAKGKEASKSRRSSRRASSGIGLAATPGLSSGGVSSSSKKLGSGKRRKTRPVIAEKELSESESEAFALFNGVDVEGGEEEEHGEEKNKENVKETKNVKAKGKEEKGEEVKSLLETKVEEKGEKEKESGRKRSSTKRRRVSSAKKKKLVQEAEMDSSQLEEIEKAIISTVGVSVDVCMRVANNTQGKEEEKSNESQALQPPKIVLDATAADNKKEDKKPEEEEEEEKEKEREKEAQVEKIASVKDLSPSVPIVAPVEEAEEVVDRVKLFQSLSKKLPGRKAEIEQLLDLFGERYQQSISKAIYIYGHSGTGKTMVVQTLLEELRVPWAYINCVEFGYAACFAYQSILTQLKGRHYGKSVLQEHFADAQVNGGALINGEPDEDKVIEMLNKIDEDTFCRNINEFVVKLAAVIRKYFSRKIRKTGTYGCQGSVECETIYLVFDKAERLRKTAIFRTLLPVLLNLNTMIQTAAIQSSAQSFANGDASNMNVCTILISNIIWEKYYLRTGGQAPWTVFFPEYSKETVLKILAKDFSLVCIQKDKEDGAGVEEDSAYKEDETVFVSFANIVYNIFHSPCRDLNELRYLLRLLYPIYRTPIQRKEMKKTDYTRLYEAILPVLRRGLTELYLRQMSTLEWGTHISNIDNRKKPSSSKGSSSETNPPLPSTKVDIELPYHSRYLLIAAYMASYNPQETDQRYFSIRKCNTASKSKRHRDRVNQHMIGPKPFLLHRFLGIFYNIIELDEFGADVGKEGGGMPLIENTADIFHQISNLVSLELIAQCSNAENLDSARFKCNVSLDQIIPIAKSVDFNIFKYLYDIAV
eukprot:Nk52_evm23s147 gene=Nk52_evmTU23s147